MNLGNFEAARAAMLIAMVSVFGGLERPMIYQEIDQVPLSRAQILLIEDDPLISEVLADFLDGWGYSVKCAGDSKTALAAAPEMRRLDLIVTDIVLPGELNGLELVAAIGEQRQGATPTVIYMSGHSPRELRSFGVTADQGRILEKPFRTIEFRRMVASILGPIASVG